MKFSIAILVALVACLSPSANGAESDVVRIFDEKLKLSNEEMFQYLKQADLKKYGFKKTVEVSTETDENGKQTTKTTIYYLVTDDCSMVRFWERVLEQRLPKELKSSKLASAIVKEMKSRTTGRKTKSCTVGLEIHPNRCSRKSTDNKKSKRSTARICILCRFCFKGSVSYAD